MEQYLAAVEREASALPPERRQELLADLAEHVDVGAGRTPRGRPGSRPGGAAGAGRSPDDRGHSAA
ncbi:HAAS signaling domain-containing protein [Streptomyces cacaoi]|uniref:HAAS signaling domain-containing protein n=1 Tax=Streptomyces cacaoi TaxID=1898 RepID=UPI003CC8223F